MSRSRPKIPTTVAQRVREEARGRCGYCLCSEILVGMPMEIEHIIPQALGGETTYNNLWLSCRRCNGFKGFLISGIDPSTGGEARLFNPRQEDWAEHFSWSINGIEIIGLTPTGRATVEALKLNNKIITTARRLWVSVGWWPPID